MRADAARRGFHRLRPREAARIVADAGICRGDLVLDLGAGNGAITAPLVRAGARVIAFELHPARAARLKQRFAGDDVKVVRADLASMRLPRRPFLVVANPPFGLTKAILKQLVGPASALEAAHLVVPAHVATRWAGGHGPAASRWARTYDARVARRLPAASIEPTPPSPTALLVIERRSRKGGHRSPARFATER